MLKGRIKPEAIKASSFYHYAHLPDDTQDYILEKIQALLDYELIVDGGPDLPATMLSVLLGLDRDLVQRIQNFDFPRDVPKCVFVDTTETLFSLEESILLAFLNLVGFDIAIFTPTGYRNIEAHLRPDSYDILTAGEYQFDLAVPNLREKRGGRATGKTGNKQGDGWLSRIFGGKPG